MPLVTSYLRKVYMPAICGLRSILLKCSLAKNPKPPTYVTIAKSLYLCMTVDEELSAEGPQDSTLCPLLLSVPFIH